MYTTSTYQSPPLGGYSRNDGTIYGVDQTNQDFNNNDGGLIGFIIMIPVAIMVIAALVMSTPH